MKNKLLLSLGSSLLVFAPVMTVVACGDDKPAEETQDQKDVKAAKAAFVATGAFGAAGAWTSTMTTAEWTAITATTTDVAMTDATYVTSTLKVAGKTFPTTTALVGTTVKYAITKTTDSMTFTVKLSKGSATDSIAYTIAKPADATETNQQIAARLANEVKLHIKAGWTTAVSETVTSSKTNANMPASVTTATALTSSILSTDFGLTVNSAAAFPTIPTGFEIKYTFTKTTATTGAGNTMAISVTGPQTSGNAVTPVNVALNIQDTDQVAYSNNLETAGNDLAKITDLALGEITFAGGTPTNAELTAAIKAKFPTITSTTTFEAEAEPAVTATTATVKAVVNTVKSVGTKAVTFTKASVAPTPQDLANTAKTSIDALTPTINFAFDATIDEAAIKANTALATLVDPIVTTPMTWAVTDLNATAKSFTITVTHTTATAKSKVFNYTVAADPAIAANADIATARTALEAYLVGVSFTADAGTTTSTTAVADKPGADIPEKALEHTDLKAATNPIISTITADALPTFPEGVAVKFAYTAATDTVTLKIEKASGTTVTLTIVVTYDATE